MYYYLAKHKFRKSLFKQDTRRISAGLLTVVVGCHQIFVCILGVWKWIYQII